MGGPGRHGVSMRTEFAKLLKYLRKHIPDSDLDVVRAAYRVANNAHSGQLRQSGEPYITHSIAVAKILAQSHLDLTTVAAGLLHDVLEDTALTRAELVDEFGEEITSLVDGVTKITSLYRTKAGPSREEKQAENLRKMLIATAQDVRVILIKLADRLHNMRTLEFLPPHKIAQISQETLNIYAPLAHRLGIERWKWELEDHAFHHLHPAEYKEMARLVAMKRREREAALNEVIQFLDDRLTEAEVSARVIGRPKHLYSIYQKMEHQGKYFDQVMDILAVRIITQTVSGCYNALGVVHQIWPPVPGRFKDYIAMPKENMYQSIHTTVIRDSGTPLEIQIRTEEMDRTARDGIAAHWKYKEGKKRGDAKGESQLQWLRQMYEWLQDTYAPDELLESVRRGVSAADVYVFTPRGEVRVFHKGATPLDFAYDIHSDIGNHCMGARVNGRMVPLRYNLQTGDVVEIITAKSQTPHLDWLDIVVTGKARTRIRQKLREMGVLESPDEPPKPQLHQMLEARPPRPAVGVVDHETRQKLIRVDGVKNVAVTFAKCCDPMPGHPVIAYVTKTPGITVHRADCKTFAMAERDPSRIMEARWEGDMHMDITVRIVTSQRPNMLADITNAIRPLNISITRAAYRDADDGKGRFDFTFQAPDDESVARVTRTIRMVPGVSEVTQTGVEESARVVKPPKRTVTAGT